MLLEHQLNEMNCKLKTKFLTMKPRTNYNNRRRTYLHNYCSALRPSKGCRLHSVTILLLSFPADISTNLQTTCIWFFLSSASLRFTFKCFLKAPSLIHSR